MVVAVVREIILYGQGYGAIKTWEKKIFYDLLWPNEISDLNNFNTTRTTSYSSSFAQLLLVVALGFSQDFFKPVQNQFSQNAATKMCHFLAYKQAKEQSSNSDSFVFQR